jgi:ethanolamine ammonia-lyase small subunit
LLVRVPGHDVGFVIADGLSAAAVQGAETARIRHDTE